MANKFDIDSSTDTHLLNETFHVFSKSPGSPTTTLGGARLKSGHTITASDIWANEIPAFFNAATQAKFDLFQSKAVKDDLCLFNGEVYQHNGTDFVSLGTANDVLVDGKTFSKNGKDVVKYHKGRTAINLTADNNNGDGSNNYTAKIYNAASSSTTFVPQFISATDKMVDGIPSLAYDAIVSDNTRILAEGLTADNDYICNSYAGIIQFNKARPQGSITVSAWEYIGDTLSESIKFNDDALEQHKSELTPKGESIHVNDDDRNKWDKAATAIQTVKRTDDSSTLITIDQSEATVSVTLSDTIATKNDITDLENKITDKTVKVNGNTPNISTSLYEIKDKADEWDIEVDGFTKNNTVTLIKDLAIPLLTEYPNTKDNLSGETDALSSGIYAQGIVIHSEVDMVLSEMDIYISPPSSGATGNIYLDIFEYTFDKNNDTNCNGKYIGSSKPVQYTSDVIDGSNPGVQEKYRKTFEFDSLFLEKNKLYAVRWSLNSPKKRFRNTNGEFEPTGQMTVTLYNHSYNNTTTNAIGCLGPSGSITTYDTKLIPYYKLSGNIYNTSSLQLQISSKADNNVVEQISNSVLEINKNLQQTEYDLVKHISNGDEDCLHVTQAEKDVWNAGGNALQEIIEGNHIEVDGNTVGVDTSSLVSDNTFITKVNELATAKANIAVENHENSTTILHVNQTEKDIWNNKLSSISVSSNNNYVGATVNNGNEVVISPKVVTDISTTETGKLIDANTIKNYVDEHTSNDNIHVTNDDKNNWNTSNIDYKALNKDVASYKDGVLTYGDGVAENINLEKTISAQYAFAKYSSSSAATISEFNLRTIKNDYTANDGANYENDCVVSDDETVNTLANLINGRGMFLRSNLTTFNDELPCLMLGDIMFKDSKSLSNFRSPLPSLTCASGMFRGCTSLTTFRTKLPNLSRAKSMFNDDSELTTVDTCLPNLTYGNNMFSNCPKLTIVNLSSTSLNNLYDGTFMFHHNTARDFNKFRGDLSSLETAEYMFTGCRLDLESVTRIADTIRDWSNDNSSPCAHRIGIGINSKSNWSDWDKFEEQKTRITNKGWIIAQWQENGVDPEPVESSALTYYYAKPASGYASPEYIDENGNKVTLILTHYTDCKDEYEIVSSREEAEIRFKLTKIEKTEE